MRARLVQLEDEKKKMEEHTVRPNPIVGDLCSVGFVACRVYFLCLDFAAGQNRKGVSKRA